MVDIPLLDAWLQDTTRRPLTPREMVEHRIFYAVHIVEPVSDKAVGLYIRAKARIDQLTAHELGNSAIYQKLVVEVQSAFLSAIIATALDTSDQLARIVQFNFNRPFSIGIDSVNTFLGISPTETPYIQDAYLDLLSWFHAVLNVATSPHLKDEDVRKELL